tara:strand:+ start:65 stop:526 length:462 start_codon:yes stop_codon:yes gene_type:complete
MNSKKLIINLLSLTFILNFSCGKNNSKSTKWTESDLNCGKAYITEILGCNTYYGVGNDIIIKCNVKYNNSEFKSNLTIDVGLFGESYCPFKVGDSVVAKFTKDSKKIVELYLLKRYMPKDNYWMDRHYNFNDVCENAKPYQIKPLFVKGKFTE